MSDIFTMINNSGVPIKISEKSARLPFQGCSSDYIETVCHGRCCWTLKDKKKDTIIFVESDQQEAITQEGGIINEVGIIQTSKEGTCIFQSKSGFCSLHGKRHNDIEVKPRSCYISPWILTKNNKLIIRNRYKLLRCYKQEPNLPAYLAFYSGLQMLFGETVSQDIVKHFNTSIGDYHTTISQERFNLVSHVMKSWHENYYGEESHV